MLINTPAIVSTHTCCSYLKCSHVSVICNLMSIHVSFFVWAIMCTSFKASTHSVVLVFYIATGHCWLCFHFLPLSMSLCGLFTCIYFVNQLYILYHILIINFRLQYKGTLKYLEESVTGLEFRIWKQWHGFCIVVENSWWRCQWVHRQISMALLHMHNAFPTEKGVQKILMSFSDIITTWLMHWG